jgi:hypothetical protein
MAYNSPQQAYPFPWPKQIGGLSFLWLTFLLSGGAIAEGEPANIPVAADIDLKPYRATYRISKDGMVAEVKRELQQLPDERWRLSDYARILFFKLEESADVRLHNGHITPLHYRYRQGPGKNKNQDIHYDWEQRTAQIELDDKTRSVKLDQPSFDKLSLQLQLRLDLLAGRLQQAQSYRLVDRGRVKHYRVEKIGEETLSLGKRQMHTIKLRQHTEGKDRETWIWVAPDLDYLIVKIVQEDEDERYEMQLESATLARAGT